MSNLIKSVYFNVDKSKKVLVNTDKKLVQMPEFKQHENKLADFEFVPGLNVLNVDDIIAEQRLKIEDDISSLAENARKEAASIIEEARANAEKIKTEAYNEGLNNGYSDGSAKAAQEAEELKKEYEEKKLEISKDYDALISELEPQFADIVTGLVENLTGIVVDGNKDVIKYIIERHMKNIPKSKQYTLHICSKDLCSIQSLRDEIMNNFEDDTAVDIVEDDTLRDNQCLIETDAHIIDCSLDVQLNNLKRELRLLALQE